MTEEEFSLNRLETGERGIITALETDGVKRRRLQDLGAVAGTPIESLFTSPYGDPTAYCIRGCVLALRNEDADKIYVKYP